MAVSLELSLDLGLVLKKSAVEFGVLGVLFDGGDSAASGTFARDEVLESDRKEVALVRVNRAALDDKDFLKEGNHIIKALSLLSNSCEENFLFNVVGHLVKFLEFKFNITACFAVKAQN